MTLRNFPRTWVLPAQARKGWGGAEFLEPPLPPVGAQVKERAAFFRGPEGPTYCPFHLVGVARV